MIYVAAPWELGWNSPIKEIELWEYPLREFDVQQFWAWPVTGIQNAFLREFADIDEIFASAARLDLQVVFVDESAPTKLREFEHPMDVLYVLGKTSYSTFRSHKREQDLAVTIETPMGSGMLWGHQATNIILYDRLIKSWQ